MGQYEFELHADKGLQLRLDVATDRLVEEFDGIFDRDTIHPMLEESALALSPNGATPYVHILAERFTRERLTGLAQSEGRIAKSTPEGARRRRRSSTSSRGPHPPELFESLRRPPRHDGHALTYSESSGLHRGPDQGSMRWFRLIATMNSCSCACRVGS